jgi:signal transduction histidine kinase
MRRRALPWVIGIVASLLLVGVMSLMVRNSTLSNDPFTGVFLAVIACYLTVSVILCTRLPSNPIGWLLLLVGFGILISGVGAEYATYTLGTSPGALPFGNAAAWLQSWGFLSAAVVPIILLLFPTGHVPSPRWRWLLIALVADIVVLTLVSWFNPGPIDVAEGIQPMNPLGIESLDAVFGAINLICGLALVPLSFGCVVSIVVRFRRATGDERQQLRWLATVAMLCAVALVLVIVTSIGVDDAGDSASLPNELAFILLLIGVGIGVPVAIAVALLRYRLYDLDVVVKKAVVATVLGALLLAVALGALVVVGRLVVGPLEDSPVATLAAGIAVGLLAWPLLRLSRRIADRIVYGGRATPYEVLTEFSGRMADAYATDDVLPRMAAIVGAGAGARRSAVWLRVGRELRLTSTWPDGVSEVPKTVRSLDELGADAFEVRHQGDDLGAITVEMPPSDPMNPAKERLIRDLAAQAGLVVRNVRLIEELRASRRRLVSAQDHERRRLERNIHDGAQQQLVALSVKVRLSEGLVERDPAKAIAMLEQIRGDTTDALENLRDLARGIYPPLLADEGLRAALEAQARKAPLPVDVDAGGVGRYDQETEAAVYFCCLEAMQNVAKYAEASRIDLAVTASAETLRFTVRDDGRGFDPETVSRGIGLQGMADRLDAIGGTLEVQSAPGAGTTITGTLPVRAGPQADAAPATDAPAVAAPAAAG